MYDHPPTDFDRLLAHHMAEARLYGADMAWTDPMSDHYGIHPPQPPIHRRPYYERVMLIANSLGVDMAEYYKWLKETQKFEDATTDDKIYEPWNPYYWNDQHEILHMSSLGVPGHHDPDQMYEEEHREYQQRLSRWSF